MPDGFSVAIMIRKPHRLKDAQRCGKRFKDAGAQVCFYCIEKPLRLQARRWDIAPLLEITPACYAQSPEMASQYGLAYKSIASMAQGLEHFDWIIPF